MSQKFPITEYNTLVFDCDGVVLDSNKVKTEAFYQATLPYGEAAAQAMVEYHIANGGVSRYKKFAYFLEQIAPAYTSLQQDTDLATLLQVYASHVREGLLNCDIAPGLEALRQKTPEVRWLIVSGGDQAELRDVFAQRGIAEWFDGGIFGSPDTKENILKREIEVGNIRQPALLIGDSYYDYRASQYVNINFIFLRGWSEWQPDDEWIRYEGISSENYIQDFFDV